MTENNNPDTISILVNSEVYNNVLPILNLLTKAGLEGVYRAVNFLNIPSLLNAVPRYIASKIQIQPEQFLNGVFLTTHEKKDVEKVVSNYLKKEKRGH